MASRRIVLDDSNPLIRYSASGWSTSPGNDTNDTFGTVFQGSEHVIRGTSASFSFQFTGSSIQVFGSNQQVATPGSQSKYDPQWACTIDGTNGLRNSIGSPNIGSNLELCVSDTLADTDHTLIVNVTSAGAPFYVDRIQYSPLANSDATEDLLWIGSDDSAFKYSGSWTTGNDDTQLTNIIGSSVSFNFTGTRLTWYGSYPFDFGRLNTSILCTLDSNTPYRVPLRGFPPGDNLTRTNQAIFTTPELPFGVHTLNLTYDLDTSLTTSPLSISYVIVANSPLQPSFTSVQSTPSGSSTPSPVLSRPTRSQLSLILGTSLGALLTLLIMTLAIVVILNRRRRRRISSTSSRHWSTFFHSHPHMPHPDQNLKAIYMNTNDALPIVVTTSTTVTTDDGRVILNWSEDEDPWARMSEDTFLDPGMTDWGVKSSKASNEMDVLNGKGGAGT